jgi:tetratricopeptide (TPR) repeat protein
MMANFYLALGVPAMCEKMLVKYISRIEEFYQKDSLEAGNAYFLMAIYYFEQNQLQKSLACYMKTLYIRKKDLGPESLGAADVHFNMGILYKKLNVPDRVLLHFTEALAIRRKIVGPLSMPVANVLEELGKFFLQTHNLQAAYNNLQECYIIRKKALQQNKCDISTDKQLTRLSVLLVFLHKKIQ